MPAAVLRIMPARSSRRWLASSASAGSSLSVGAYRLLMRSATVMRHLPRIGRGEAGTRPCVVMQDTAARVGLGRIISAMDASPAQTAVERLVAAGCLPRDPLPWILGSDEPYAVWHALRHVLARPSDDAEVEAARRASVASPEVVALAESLGRSARPRGRHDAQFAPQPARAPRGTGCAHRRLRRARCRRREPDRAPGT